MNEHQYFQAIEAHFIGLRGAPLLLSPADFQVARAWWKEGIPLDLILRTLDEIFERRRESSTEGTIQTLRYCSRAVEGAWRAVAEAQRAGRREVPEPIDLRERLGRLARALPDGIPDRERRATEIRGLEGTAREVEARLAEIDAAMLEAACAEVEDEVLEELEARVERDLTGVADRMAPDEVETVRARLLEQRLRRHLELPMLTLFSES